MLRWLIIDGNKLFLNLLVLHEKDDMLLPLRKSRPCALTLVVGSR